MNQGLEAIKSYEATLSQNFGYQIGISISALRAAGREKQDSGDLDEAISIYRYIVDAIKTGPTIEYYQHYIQIVCRQQSPDLKKLDVQHSYRIT